MVEIDCVSKRYRLKSGWKTVLDEASIVFPVGKNVGILGLNGAGKSTLLRIIAGVEPPDSGTVYRGMRLSWPIGFGGGVHNSMTGRENARFIARIYGAPLKKVETFAEEFSELGDYFNMPVRTYSSGMRARLAFAVSMAAEFDCYLVDEVVAVGDARFNKKYRDAFKERLKSASMIMVSHSVKTIREFCQSGAVLHDGRLGYYESLDDAMKTYDAIIKSY